MLYVMSYVHTNMYALHMHVIHRHDRYVFMYVREVYVYVKNLISDLGSEQFEMRNHLEREILVSRSQILDREPSLEI